MPLICLDYSALTDNKIPYCRQKKAWRRQTAWEDPMNLLMDASWKSHLQLPKVGQALYLPFHLSLKPDLCDVGPWQGKQELAISTVRPFPAPKYLTILINFALQLNAGQAGGAGGSDFPTAPSPFADPAVQDSEVPYENLSVDKGHLLPAMKPPLLPESRVSCPHCTQPQLDSAGLPFTARLDSQHVLPIKTLSGAPKVLSSSLCQFHFKPFQAYTNYAVFGAQAHLSLHTQCI